MHLMLRRINRGHRRLHIPLGILAPDVGGRLGGHVHRDHFAAPVSRLVRGGGPFDGHNGGTRLGGDLASHADERQRQPYASHYDEARAERLVSHPDCSLPRGCLIGQVLHESWSCGDAFGAWYVLWTS